MRVAGVSKRYGGTVALRGVDLDLQGGRANLIVGANGSGKSTLLGILAGSIRPTTGSVVIGPDGPGGREGIGLLSHETMAYGDLTGKQNIALAAEVYGLDAESAWKEVSERFELGSFALRPLRTNSRGQRQRIALARAMVHQPWVLLLDEPTTGLDAKGVERLLRVTQQEIERGAVVVVVAHDVDTWSGLEPRVVKLDRGRVESFT